MKRNPLFFLWLSPALLLASCGCAASFGSSDPSGEDPARQNVNGSEESSVLSSLSSETNYSTGYESSYTTLVSTSLAPVSSTSNEESVSSVESIPFDLAAAKEGLKKSKPTKIVTNHDYSLAGYEVQLNFHSTLLIDYGDDVRSAYSYVYQVLAEIVDDNSPLYRTISGKKYSEGARIGDGVEWVNAFEGAATLSGLDLSTALTGVDGGRYIAYGQPKNPIAFLGQDYGIDNLSYSVEFEAVESGYRVSAFTMDFTMIGYADLYGESIAIVHSESLYSYDPVTVTIPK